MRPRQLLTFLLPIALLACDRTSAPGSDPDDGGAAFDGSFDSDAGSFVLQRVTTTLPNLEPVIIELVGSNVIVDSAGETVSVDVAIRNAGEHVLYAPATVWLRDFQPREVKPLNADVLLPTEEVFSDTWGFRYDDLFGEDGRLTPGETSARKHWRFEDPGGAPFSFSVRAEFSMAPRSTISGLAFIDSNQNGERDGDEPPFEHGWIVRLTTPDGQVREAEPHGGGRYAFVVEQSGLYRVEFIVLIEPVYCVTTPNPIEVLLTPGPDGHPQSYDGANFGFAFGPCFEPLPAIRLTDLPPEEVEPQDPYTLIELRVVGDVLILTAGFSGCSPEHPFELVAADELLWPVPEDGLPPLLPWMLLNHDDRGEFCDAYFTRTLAFDLSPLRELHDGPILVEFYDASGQIHDLVYEP